MIKNKPKIVFITESIRRDIQMPLKKIRDFDVVHFYLKAPYSDMSEADLKDCRKVKIGELLDAIVQEKPDIIQGVEPFGSKLGLRLSHISLQAKLKTNAKLITPVFENRLIRERYSIIQRVVLRLFCPKFFSSCDAIMALNSGALRNVRYYFKGAKIKTGILWGVWGVDLSFFSPASKKQKNQISYVGRWVEEKGIMYLLEGFRQATREISDLKLKFVGQGPLEREMRKFISNYGLSDKVEFVGFAPNEQLPKYFSEAELVAYPSITTKTWEEQVGTVNMQALACGTPVLTTLSGAIPEFIKNGEGAILVDEKDAQAIANAIIKFFKNEDLRKNLTSKARQWARKYDINDGIRQAEEFLNEIITEA